MASDPYSDAVIREWRCFYCDEVFTTREAAKEHFGTYEDGIGDGVACQLTKDEKGLVGLLREAWDELQKYHVEDSAAYRQFYTLGSEHAAALRRAEEDGYAKGLRDGLVLKAADAKRREQEKE